MLPPVCFTCGRILCDRDEEFYTKTKAWKADEKLTEDQIADKIAKLLDEMHVREQCCISTVITSVYLIDIII